MRFGIAPRAAPHPDPAKRRAKEGNHYGHYDAHWRYVGPTTGAVPTAPRGEPGFPHKREAAPRGGARDRADDEKSGLLDALREHSDRPRGESHRGGQHGAKRRG